MADAAVNPLRASGKGRTIVLWVCQILGALTFLMAGAAKIEGGPEMIQLFHKIGIGQWLRYLTGAIEVAGAVLLLVPAWAAIGAATLACVMVGAAATNLFVMHDSTPMPLVVILFTLQVVVLWGRWVGLVTSRTNRRRTGVPKPPSNGLVSPGGKPRIGVGTLEARD